MSFRLIDHIHQIKAKVEVLYKSSRSHALIVNGQAGWGKTTAVDEALEMAGLKGSHLSSYSTPLNLFQHLSQHPSKITVMDDVAGLFTDKAGMAILKAAAWPSPRGRIISWGSTTSRIDSQDFEFRGKLIIVCNTFPSTADAKAVKSRSLIHDFGVSVELAKELLKKAAKDKEWFEDLSTAKKVASYLCERLSPKNLDQVSYRTLHIGYDMAMHNPIEWRELLSSMIQISASDPKDVILELSDQGLKVNDQVQEFERLTGMRRRTFFKYRKEMDLVKNGR